MKYLSVTKGFKTRLNYLFLIFILFSNSLAAQLKWDGEASDGQWNSAANWVGDVVPAPGDNVQLDNSFVAVDYTVTLPGGSLAITVKTISISPDNGRHIELVLPPSNVATVPAFAATGPGYGITINNGGIFSNRSGNTSGNAVLVADSIQINNGGQYTHNTRASHATLVSLLSKSPGTETGIFKFDVPGGSYTFSSANRFYGILMFNSEASGGTQTYNAIAASPLNINGDLVINTGVTVNLDITNNVIIKRDYIQNGGVFNIASQPNNNTTFIKGNLIQSSGSITESSTGLPVMELNGVNIQQVNISGGIINSVNFRINNPAGISLLSDISLPFKLALVNGIVHTNLFKVNLLSTCSLIADSASNNSFINGRLRKEGLNGSFHFLFPVGKGIVQRWLELKNATGSYTVEFFKSNPQLLSNVVGTGVDHISSLEYWSVEADAANATANIELSFDNVNSGGVTDLSSLRVAQLLSVVWQDAGNTGTTGVVGIGSVISDVARFIAPNTNTYFTLSSNAALQNPLPVRDFLFSAQKTNEAVQLIWKTDNALLPVWFELQASSDGIHFSTIANIKAIKDGFDYQYRDSRLVVSMQWYRLQVIGISETFYSNIISVKGNDKTFSRIIPSVIHGNALLQLNSSHNANLRIIINDIIGRNIAGFQYKISAGLNSIPLRLSDLPAGSYLLSAREGSYCLASIQFVKL